MKLINLEKIKNRIKTYFSNPANCMLVFFFIAFLGLSIYPITAMIKEMFIVHAGIEKTLISAKKGTFTLYHIQKLFAPGEWSVTSFYIPFKNSFCLAFLGQALQ